MVCTLVAVFLAERVGFEPTVTTSATTVFETAPIGRSGTSPIAQAIIPGFGLKLNLLAPFWILNGANPPFGHFSHQHIGRRGFAVHKEDLFKRVH